MVRTFGVSVTDVVQDTAGNVVSGAQLRVYPTEANAVAQTSQITALLKKDGTAYGTTYLVTDAKGRFPFRITADPYDQVWIREPGGSVWAIEAAEVDDAKADLDSGGKLLVAQKPADRGWPKFQGNVADQAAMLALSTAVNGDWCIRTDLNARFDLTGTTFSTLAHWTQVPGGAGGSTSDETIRDVAYAGITAGTGISVVVNDALDIVTISENLDELVVYTTGLIAAGGEWQVRYTGSAWPALTTVPLAFRSSGLPIIWNSQFHSAALSPTEARENDVWRKRV